MTVRCIEDVEKYLELLDTKIKDLQKEKRLIIKALKEQNTQFQIVKRKHILEVKEGNIIVEI